MRIFLEKSKTAGDFKRSRPWDISNLNGTKTESAWIKFNLRISNLEYIGFKFCRLPLRNVTCSFNTLDIHIIARGWNEAEDDIEIVEFEKHVKHALKPEEDLNFCSFSPAAVWIFSIYNCLFSLKIDWKLTKVEFSPVVSNGWNVQTPTNKRAGSLLCSMRYKFHTKNVTPHADWPLQWKLIILYILI